MAKLFDKSIKMGSSGFFEVFFCQIFVSFLLSKVFDLIPFEISSKFDILEKGWNTIYTTKKGHSE